jgi:translation initiation factor IF-2
VRIIQHNIIYELITSVEEAMAELLDPEYREVKLGMTEVRATFPLAKGQVAGCMVTEGMIKRDAHARLLRKDEVIHEGRIGTLKRFKDDVTEVRAGYECGIQITGCNDYKEGDRIECYEIHEFRPKLR